MAKKVILDTDPGVDDAMAIFLAVVSPEIELLGLTTIFGNADVDVTTQNALLLLELAGRQDIPVIKGAASPLVRPYAGPVPHVHGDNGLGNAVLPAIEGSAKSIEVADWVYQQASEAPGEITMLTVGPVTNLAIAFKKYPDLVDLLREVVVMGGNADIPGNITPAAEANIYNDPEAADLVLGTSCPTTMVGLDVTHQVNMTGEEIRMISGGGKRLNQFLGEIIPLYQAFFEATNGIDGIYLHDPTAVMYLIAPELFKTIDCPMRVETESFSRGKTWPNFGGTDHDSPEAWENRPRVSIGMQVDHKAVIQEVIARLS
ncbi:MAG: nucleoside hydrolase [Rhodothermaceae bacterium]|nr:nucleoside hydrolase [Rhodothermaceae bacterium]